MKVVVTGGAGYIGSHATYRLIEQGHEVVIIDNLSKGYKDNIHPKAKFYQADIRDIEALTKIFEKEMPIDGVMNFAASIVVPESVSKPLEYFDNNVYGVERLLTVIKDFKIKNFVFSSTAAVYGDPDSKLVETSPTKPINPYGESKLAAEFLIKSWANAYDSNCIIFRYFNVAGTHESGKIGARGKNLTHLLPSITDVAVGLRDSFKVFGSDYNTRDGSCIRDYIHVVDLVDAHIMGMKYLIEGGKSEVINLSSSKGYTVLEVLKTAIRELKIDIPYTIEERRPGDPSTLIANNSKAKEILNWEPKHNLESMITSDYAFRLKTKDEF